MKASEIIREHLEEVKQEAVQRYRDVLDCKGRIQFSVYIDDSGKVESLQDVQGGSSYWPDSLKVLTVAAPFFDPWDYTEEPKPEEEAEREKAEAEIVDWLVEEYKSQISDVMRECIRSREEREEEEEGEEEIVYDWGVCPESEVYRDTTETNHISDASDWADDVKGAIKLARKKAAEDGENYTVMKYYRDGGDCAWPEYLTVEPNGGVWCDNNNVLMDL